MTVDRVVVITFLTLFLGLVHGQIDVALSAPSEVARIELHVDGAKVADLGPPWRATIDLGPEIAPRELVAVSLGRDGERLGEARQWINRARPRAEASFALERDSEGRVTAARLVWRCLVSPRPKTVSVTFDGHPVDVAQLPRIPIPPHEASVTHLLLADLTFSGGISATAVASLGGQRRDQAEGELTAFPVRVPGGSKPKAGELDGWFEAAGKSLPVAAVESGLAEVPFVLAGNAGSYPIPPVPLAYSIRGAGMIRPWRASSRWRTTSFREPGEGPPASPRPWPSPRSPRRVASGGEPWFYCWAREP